MNSRRGVALILALFASAILVTLSLAFIALAVGESKTSRSAGYEGASIEAANFGLEFALNYMGTGNSAKIPNFGGTEPFNTWQSFVWPNFGGPGNTLQKVVASPRIHLGKPVVVESPEEDPTLDSFETDPVLRNMKLTRRIRVVRPVRGGARLPDGLLELDGGNLAFTFNVVVVPVKSRTGVSSYKLISTARVFSGERRGEDFVTDKPVASRVVQAQVLPDSPSNYLHFLANGRSFNAQGLGEGNTSKATYDGVTVDISDFAMIPANYTENGPMRVDGQDPEKRNISPGMRTWVDLSGNLRFAPGSKGPAQGGNVTFRDPLMINKGTNDYIDDKVDDTNSGIFQAGIRNKTPRMGLPTGDLETLRTVAKDATLPDPNPNALRNAFFDVPTIQIPGAKGNTVPPPKNTRGVDGDPFVEYLGNDKNGKPIFKNFDYRPRLPNVEVTLDGPDVIVQRRDTLTDQPIGSPDVFKVEKLNKGVLFVEGGNAVVKPGTRPFTGQLSIVAGDSQARKYVDATTRLSQDSIYAQAAAEYFEFQKTRWANDRKSGADLPPANYPTPPYTVAQLRQFPGLSVPAGNQLAGLPDDQMLWPPPPKEVDREGNLVVAGDIKYSDSRAQGGNVLGLFAENFILLNDNTPEVVDSTGEKAHKLRIDAVMMSFKRSVQIDWDNTGRQKEDVWKTLTSPGYNGTLELRGSIVGEYVDIEGDVQGRGYSVQDFLHDPILRYQRPPFMPTWNFADLPGGYRFTITHYTDRGAFSTDSALP